MNTTDLIVSFLKLFPAVWEPIHDHAALSIFIAFVLLAAADAVLGAIDAHKSGTFDRVKFGTDTKLLTGTAMGAVALLYVQAQMAGVYGPGFALAVITLLGPRCYVLLADVRDKLASVLGLTITLPSQLTT